MKSDRVFWGLILILFGILFTLKNMGFIDFQFSSIWKWWPLLLVYWGFSALLKDKSGRSSPYLYGVQIIILGILVYVIVRTTPTQTAGRRFQYEYKDDKQSMDAERTYQFDVPMEQDIKTALLDLTFGAGELKLRGGNSDQLIGADATTNLGNYSFENTMAKGDATIKLGYTSKQLEYHQGIFSNALAIELHPTVAWNIMLETGASKADLDFSAVKVKNIDIKGGVSRLKLKLGQPAGQMNVAVETGASSITILIPADARCELMMEDGLSSKTIKGLDQIEIGKYRSSNFDAEADAGSIFIRLESGLSKIDVKTY